MYLMYVDESGDCGLSNKSPTKFFILSGMVMHELRWKETIERLIDFRKRMKTTFGIRLRDEIHANDMIYNPGNTFGLLPRNTRLTVLRHFINEIALLNEVSIINIVIDKTNKPAGYDVFEMAWKVLLQRFENTINNKNFPGRSNIEDLGMIFPDHTDNKKLRILIRKMRHYNPIPNNPHHGPGYRSIPLGTVIEDPNFRDSKDSYIIQAIDTAAYFLKQFVDPNKYMKKKGAHKYFIRLDPVLCKNASRTDRYGIVWL